MNHKRVQCLMQKLDIKCIKFFHKSRRYNSYKGKVGKVAISRVNRQFTTIYSTSETGHRWKISLGS